MKLMFASDIHGSSSDCEIIKELFLIENADKLVLCGDILYHGPRNDLPKSYNPKKVIEILNSISEDIIAVRGNCDSEVDQMVLDFPMMETYAVIYDGTIRIYITHGHIYNCDNPLNFKDNDVLIHGHTHVLKAEKVKNFYFLNPGSVAIPKENNEKTYMIYEDGKFSIKTLEQKIIKELEVK